VIIIGMFMSILDTSIVNVAIPTIQHEYGATTNDIQWIATAYTLCLGVVVPASAWLGDRFGLRQLYLAALLSFSAMSALCGLAWSLPAMIVFRVLQAIPGGILPVICMTMAYRIVPRHKIGSAMGMYGLGVVVAPAVGPSLGGYLVQYVNWRLIFYINVPVGLLGTLAAYLVLATLPKPPPRRFDIPGFVTIAAGLSALLLALSEGQQWHWDSYPVLMLIAAGLQFLSLFVVVELAVDAPLLNIRLFTHWPFVNSLLLITIIMTSLFATMFYVPLFLQQGQQLPALNAGALLIPQALVLVMLTPFSGRIYDRCGPRWPAVIGFALNGIGTYLLCVGIGPDMTRDDIMWWLSVRALGQGLSMTPVMTSGLSSLPGPIVNQGSAVNNLIQRVSAAFGLAILTAIASQMQAQAVADQNALIPQAATLLPERVVQLSNQGPAGLYPMYQHIQLLGLSAAYRNIFLMLTVAAAAGVLLALRLPSGRPPGRPGPQRQRTQAGQPRGR
jgi:EmrB/QacA subfamily drug resistance transporter